MDIKMEKMWIIVCKEQNKKKKYMKATIQPSYADIKLQFFILPNFIGIFCNFNI